MIIRMRLFKRSNGVWYIEYERGKWKSLRTKNKAHAQKLYNAHKLELLEGRIHHIKGTSKYNLEQFTNEFEIWSESNQTHSTYRANRLALKKLKKAAGMYARIDALNLKHIDIMITQAKAAKLSPHSINAYIRHIRAVFNKAVAWNYLKTNPFRDAREIKAERRPAAYMPTQQEITKFLASIDDVDKRRLATAYLATGRRRNELLQLTWFDVHLDTGQYLVRKSKAHLTRWYPINNVFRAVLEAMPKKSGRVFNRWSHPDTISHIIKDALRQAKLGHMRLHDLRHTFASQVLMQGSTLKDVQELLGHSEIRTTEIYAHLTQDHLAKAADIKLGPVDLVSNKK